MMKISKILGEGIPFPFSILYARGTRKYFMRIYKEIAGEVASEMGAGHLLDLGTGHGLVPVEIAKIVPNIKITGIDISRDMVRIARKNAEREGVADRVKFQVEDANNLSFDDGSFDFIISTGAMHHWSNPVAVFNEVHRVLKDGGEAWIYDLRRDARKEEIEEMQTALKLASWTFTGLGAMFSIKEAYTPDEIRERLGKTLFEDYKIKETPIMMKVILKK